MSSHVFISHSSKDDGFVKELREALEGLGMSVWADSRELLVGSRLVPEIEAAIETARQFLVVLSPNTVNAPWVRREIQKALKVERERRVEGYKVIPLLRQGVEPSALPLWFDDDAVGDREAIQAGWITEALPAILAALGERLPDDRAPIEAVAPQPIEELILKLGDLKIETLDGRRRARAVAQLVYEPAAPSARTVESQPFLFTAPLGPIEAEELRWYLEEYYIWPIGIFKERAEHIEARLPEWGRALYDAALAPRVAVESLNAWQQADDDERRFSVFVDDRLIEGSSDEAQAAAGEAAAELLGLPWELLHDGRAFLFHGKSPVRVRRRLPNRHPQQIRLARLPIRILLVSPRPEDKRTSYLDHRISARPLVEALESLGELAKLSILTPPTFPALEEALTKAAKAGEPFDVVHFDGHGIYDRRLGLGGFCFEDPNDVQLLERRAMELVNAERMAGVIRDQRIPLVFLEACVTAKVEGDAMASVAAKLLVEGVTSVVAMSHTVLVETARRFVKAFYGEITRGRRVGAAMLAGQRELYDDSYRGKLMGAGELRLQDWFVPVLYQEEQDPQLVSRLPPEDVQQLQAVRRRLSLGRLPDPQPHEFQGRSRELLALERLLAREPYAVVRGRGGEGKTTLAVELARWLVRTRRFRRAAFVSFEQYTDARGVLISLGQQLLPEGDKWHVAPDEGLNVALQPVERALRDRATIIVLDNLESILPDHTGELPPGAAPLEELFGLCRLLLDASPATRIVFTTREPLPAPFDDRRREILLGALSRVDAVALVGKVMKQHGLTPRTDDLGADPQEVVELVEAVDRHARALVLLARELARTGVRATTENLRRLMEELHSRHPDDRENSLYASVELSLRRLPSETRELISVLGFFQGGAHVAVLGQMLDAEPETMKSLANQLIEVGLAESMGYGHLRLDPALPPYLLREMGAAEQEEVRGRWAVAMGQLTAFLYEQQFKDIEAAAQLALLELPNLLVMLSWMQEHAAPEVVVNLAERVEALFSRLGIQQAREQATRVRERAAQSLGDWSHAHFLTESANVDRLLERGDIQAAYEAAQRLFNRSFEAGEEAYAGAGYDIAFSLLNYGRVLQRGGAAEYALVSLDEARVRFQALADAGNESAAQMVSVALSLNGNCLRSLGRFDEAASAFEESIRRAEKLGDKRQVAASKGNLGTVFVQQQRYSEALEIYQEAQRIFEAIGEPGAVASALHQIGMVYRQVGQHEQAEHAYRQALAINVQQQSTSGEASGLTELGNLYSSLNRLEEAVKCFRQAAAIYIRSKDQSREGVVRHNMAVTLMQMSRYDEARQELLRAIECNEPYGYTAQPWKTWGLLQELELIDGRPEDAARAWHKAVETYIAYRREGGQGMTVGAQICAAVAEAIAQGNTGDLEQQLAQFETTDVPPSARSLLSKVRAVLHGERAASLADDPELSFYDAVELQLLTEALAQT